MGDDLPAALSDCRAVIDFTHADATATLAQICAQFGKILVIGTTGQDAASRRSVKDSAREIPIVFAPNFSVGVNALFWLTRRAAEILGPDFDLEVMEMHHRLKKDAPSGTARRLAEILADVRGLTYEKDVRHGRVGMIGERTTSEIGLHAVRGGDVVGDHTVIYANIGERLELTHKASSRDTFARGALRAVKWAQSQRPGLYDMQDVLGLK
jgi:4-hydroxy-tetrahydrodipicolinate reductase